jgi:hypothetical protein
MYGTWTIFAWVRVQAGDGLKIQGFYEVLRQKRAANLQRRQNGRPEEIVLPVTVRDF